MKKYIILIGLTLSLIPWITSTNRNQNKFYFEYFSEEQISFEYYLEKDPILNAIAYVESGYDTLALGKDNDKGLLQITPIMVKEINRILAIQKDDKRYTLDDRKYPIKSIEMFYIFHDFYGNECPEAIARSWNSGPKWDKKTHLTDKYWKKVNNVLASL
jgi:soluble lytic murein transglycosylase-like protein